MVETKAHNYEYSYGDETQTIMETNTMTRLSNSIFQPNVIVMNSRKVSTPLLVRFLIRNLRWGLGSVKVFNIA